MRKIMTVTGYITLVDDDVFEWASKRKWYVHHKKGDSPYVHAHTKPNLLLSRAIMGVEDSKLQVDHKDGNTLDNRRSNLRVCSLRDNVRNRKPGGNRRFKGTYKTPTAWAVKIQGKHLGTFKNEEDAARAYDVKARDIYGDFARLNFQ